ncbi:nucleotide-binding alpha-beta plait domain-containing protein [Artemisia annua]|uniref:Nucleotide-binding alpha-beta plait domain-containing protein n=1 Tax=Artemisia annua TaxID=35608 RepID=A0A2U1KU30_ARTAN|nr:nucleotide-binding alpha-beta plait domain-containing protein [Artemisia annua]
MKHLLRKIYLSYHIKKTKGNGSLQKRLDKMSLSKKDGKSCYKKGKVHAKEMEKPKITKKRKCGFASVHQAKPASSKLKHRVEEYGNVNHPRRKIKAKNLKPQENRSVKKKSSGAEKQRGFSSLSKAAESSKPTRKRKQNNKSKASFSKKNLKHHSQGTPKKPKFDGEVQNGKIVLKPGNHKRKNARTHEFRGDGNNKNAHKKNPFKKQKGNICERYKSMNPKSNARGSRGHVDCRNFTRYTDPYAPKYAVSALNSYHEPLAGYSGYLQSVLLEPAYRSQNSSRYLGRDVLPAVQPYSLYCPSEYVQIAHDPYHSGLARAVQRDGGGAALFTYVGGPLLPASQGRNPASYYQACSSYSGAYHNQQTYH